MMPIAKTAPSQPPHPAPLGSIEPSRRAADFTCDFCHKILSSEKRLLAHLCRLKRRALQRGERCVNIGFHAYQRFWQRRMNPRRMPGWDDFDTSSFYLGFVRFGRYVLDINAINPAGFVDFLLRGEVGLDHWCQDTHYQVYVRELTKLEPPWEAMQRNILLMEQWSIDQREPWVDFFRKVAPAQAVMWIVSGRLSPWILFTAASARDLLERLSPEQEAMVFSVIEETFWRIKLERHAAEVAEIVATLADYRV